MLFHDRTPRGTPADSPGSKRCCTLHVVTGKMVSVDFVTLRGFFTTSPPNVDIKVLMLVVKMLINCMSSLKTSTLDTRTKYHMITYIVLGIPLKICMVVHKCG